LKYNNKEGQTLIFRGREREKKKGSSTTNWTTIGDTHHINRKKTQQHVQQHGGNVFLDARRRRTRRLKCVGASHVPLGVIHVHTSLF